MSERIVDDPSLHGWVDEGGKWVWGGGADNEHPIVDGNNVGEVTTWDGAKWTPDSSLTIDARGNATFDATSANVLTIKRSGGTGGNASIQYVSPLNTFYTGVSVTGGDFSISPDINLNNAVFTITNTGNAVFSGRVSSENGSFYRSSADACGLKFHVGKRILPLDNAGNFANGQIDIGENSYKFKDAHFSGTVDAAGFTVNGSPISGGGGPDLRADRGDGTGAVYFGDSDSNYLFYNSTSFYFEGGSVTAADFIATSDERAKDNITTAPVGLIDSLKGREWDWKESGEKGSGVVAQELEQILPHLVHTDDEGMKSVAYNGLVAYLIEEVKALKAEVEALKS